jgi:ankyrin repeat protein
MTKAAFFNAVQRQDVEAVRAILDARPALRDAVDRQGRTALHLACSDPSPTVVRMVSLLLERGFDIEQTVGRDRCPPLFFAVARGRNPHVVKLLLKAGAKVANAPGGALFAAGWYDDVHILKILVDAGANVNAVADVSAFLACWNWRKFEAAKALVTLGANPNYRHPKNGKTALHYGIERAFDPAHLRWLVKHGASPDIKNGEGRTAREQAAKKRDKRWFEAISRPSPGSTRSF